MEQLGLWSIECDYEMTIIAHSQTRQHSGDEYLLPVSRDDAW